MGLLRDARRVLTGGGFEQREEVAAACVRSVADGLLAPGTPGAVGLKDAAKDLLIAVDALPRPPAGTARLADAVVAEAEAGVWERMREAAAVLRGEVESPGGFHRARAAGVFERLTGVTPGAAQETALDVWSRIYGAASSILHGRSAGPGEAAALYVAILGAARNLLVPLPARAARVLELAALQHPGEAEARELAGWADPRATGYFLRSGPAAAWLEVLTSTRRTCCWADGAAGLWPAAPFLEHLAAVAPETARPWLHGHAVQLAAAGPQVLVDLLLLAQDGALTSAGVRLLLPYVLVPVRDGEPVKRADWPRGLTARWAGRLPMAGRDRDWVFVVEALLHDVVDSGRLAFQAMMKRPHPGPELSPADAVRLAHSDPEVEKEIARTWAVLLPAGDVMVLLRELVATIHGQGPGPFRSARMVRAVLAGLLCRNVESDTKGPSTGATWTRSASRRTGSSSRPRSSARSWDRCWPGRSWTSPRRTPQPASRWPSGCGHGNGSPMRTPTCTTGCLPPTWPRTRPLVPRARGSGGTGRSRSPCGCWPPALRRKARGWPPWSCRTARPSGPPASTSGRGRRLARPRPPGKRTRSCPPASTPA